MSEFDKAKTKTEYEQPTFTETVSDAFSQFQYGQTIPKLKPGIEVETGNVKSGTLSITSTGTQSVSLGWKPSLVKTEAIMSGATGAFSSGTRTSSFERTLYAFGTAGAWNSASSSILLNDTLSTTEAFVDIKANGFDLRTTSFGPTATVVWTAYA